jgi:hypothetical protein
MLESWGRMLGQRVYQRREKVSCDKHERGEVWKRATNAWLPGSELMGKDAHALGCSRSGPSF